MAIDNAEERRAAAAVPIGPGVTPNVDKDAEWRAQSAGGFYAADNAGTQGGVTQSPEGSPALSPVMSPILPRIPLILGN